MKKILFLLLVFLIKLNAYEYKIYENTSKTYIIYYFDENGILTYRRIQNGNSLTSTDSARFMSTLGRLKIGETSYISNSLFQSYLKNDIQFLNDLFIQQLQAILNYYYNDNFFSDTNCINYNDYELLYNSDGLAVESIVNGKWAGLYEDSGQSGYLYNEKGELLYINGEPASFFEKINNKLLKRFKINLESIFIKNIFYPLLVLIFACVIFRSVIRMAFKAFLIRFYDKKIGQLEKRRENIENA